MNTFNYVRYMASLLPNIELKLRPKKQWECPECKATTLYYHVSEWFCTGCSQLFGKKTIQSLVANEVFGDVQYCKNPDCKKCEVIKASAESEECKCPIIGLGIVHTEECEQYQPPTK